MCKTVFFGHCLFSPQHQALQFLPICKADMLFGTIGRGDKLEVNVVHRQAIEFNRSITTTIFEDRYIKYRIFIEAEKLDDLSHL